MDQNQRYTLEEVAEILLRRDTRSIQSAVDKGIIPTISYDAQNMTISAVALAKQMGVDNFDEPFIDEKEARKLLGLSDNEKVTEYCKKFGINMYRLSNGRGVECLYRRSDIENFFRLSLEWYPYGNMRAAYRVQQGLVLSLVGAIMPVFKDSNFKDIFERYLKGEDPKTIATALQLNLDYVRHALGKIVTKFAMQLRLIIEWVDIFAKTEYAKMHPVLVLATMDELKKENQKLLHQVSVLAGKNNIEVLISDDDMAKQAALDTKFQDIPGVSASLRNCLSAARPRIVTPRDATNYTRAEFMKVRNVGYKAVFELEDILHTYGVWWKEEQK